MTKDRFEKTDRLLTIMLTLWLVLSLGEKVVKGDFSLFLTVYLILLCILSGYVSFLCSQLPKSERPRANWGSNCGLEIHPYVTTILLIILTLICLHNVWIRQFR